MSIFIGNLLAKPTVNAIIKKQFSYMHVYTDVTQSVKNRLKSQNLKAFDFHH